MYKQVLSIDPGLRNLAMCVMNTNYEIMLWDTYNLLDSDDYHCGGVLKNGKVCGKKCSMKYSTAPDSVASNSTAPNSVASNSTAPNNVASNSVATVFTCKTHFPKEIIKTTRNNFKKKPVTSYLSQDIALAVITRVQEIYDQNKAVFDGLTAIFIEKQPTCNPKSLFMSHILYAKLIDIFGDTIPIRYVRASQKLKAYTGPEIVCKLKGKYAQRKWLSVQYTRWYLENKFSQEQCGRWLPFFLGHSKRDDLADVNGFCISVIDGIPKKQFRHKNGNDLK